MYEYEEIRRLFIDLLISDQETDGHPTLAPGQEPSTREAMSAILLDPDLLRAHLSWLFANDPTKRHRRILPEERLHEVMDRGIDVLDSRELARLALNPIALTDLSESIAEWMPAAWMDRIEEHANELVSRHGVSIVIEDPVVAPSRELLTMGALQEAGPSRQRWEFEVAAEQCRWEPALPDDLGDHLARITVEKDETSGTLELLVEGFLRLGIGYLLEAIWMTEDGSVRSLGQIEDDFVPLLLREPDGASPAPGDRLELYQRFRGTMAKAGWTVRTTLAFP